MSAIDKESLNLVQVLQLHEAVDHTESAAGSAVLLRSLIQPSTNLEYIQSRQTHWPRSPPTTPCGKPLGIVSTNIDAGRAICLSFSTRACARPFPIMTLNGHGIRRQYLQDRQRGPRGGVALPGRFVVESSCLRGVVHRRDDAGADLQDHRRAETAGQVGLFTPKRKFIPRRFSEWILAGPAIAVSPYVPASLGLDMSISPGLAIVGLAWTGGYVFYSLFI